MKKWSKFILAIMLIAIAISLFVGCKKIETIQLTFVSNDQQYATTMGIDEAKDILASQPTREGYVFKGWYLDKGTWTQEVESSNVEEITKGSTSMNVYAYWVEIVNKITVAFCDYQGAILLEKDYERTDDQLAKDMASLRPSQKPDDEMYTYTFDKWECNTDDLTQGFFNATPIYTAEYRVFDFKYYVDGELVYTDHVRYGSDADRNLVSNPQKPSTEQYDYVFTGWEGSFENITQDTSVYAKFQQNLKKFNVTFNYGNNKSTTTKVEYGATAIAPSESQLVKSSTAQYSYVFVGWDNTFDNIKQDTVVNAKYVEQVRMYDVKFWVDSTCIKSYNVPYGSKVDPPSTVIKDLEDGFTYKFLGWDVAFDNIMSNLDVHAQFEQISHTYTVEYVNWEGTPLFSEQVESGEASTYRGETPTRQSNDKYDYIFAGWTDSDKLQAITRNLTVQATFTQQIKTFTVVFYYGDGKTAKFGDIPYGTDFTGTNLVPSDKEVEKASTPQYEYEFVGWDTTFDNITANTYISAKYTQKVRSYDVSFYVDDTCIKFESVLYGSSVEAPAQPVKVLNDGYTYEFVEWDRAFDNIVEDTVVNAIFDKIVNTFEIKYVNWDGTLLYTDNVESAGVSTYVGETPVREPNDKYTYNFIGWTNQEALECVTYSFATQAVYEEVVRTYTVTFNYGHGLQKVIEGVPYGTSLIDSSEIPTDTDKSSTAQYDFTFIDWDKYFGYVSSDMDVNAIYKETIRRYIVTFVNDGSVVKTQEVEYGKCPTAPLDIISKKDTLQWNYTYLGWEITDNDIVDDANDFIGVDPNTSIVEGEITYTAIYLRAIQRYTVKFFNDEGDREPIGEITVDYGTNILESDLAPTPSKASTPKYDYEFIGWNRDLSFVSANIETYATYESNIRSYKVTFMNDEDVYEVFTVEYGSASPRPAIDPTKPSTVQYDFVFLGWDGLMSYVEGDTTVTANYRNDLRYYKVTYFNLATYELISTVEMGYGSKITTKIARDGYDFDSWYRDPNCNTVFNMDEEFVDGTMMLFGNTVMKGLIFNSDNAITGYEGTEPNLVIPIAANGKKVNTIKKEAFKENSVIGSVYIPNTITKIEAYAFSELNLTESGGIYVQSEKKWYGTPSGWDQYWNRNSLTSFHESDRPVTYGVDGIYTVGDFQYILIADDNTAVVDKFINNNTAKAYIVDTLEHQKASFVSEVETDEKTGVQRDVYTITYQTNTYSVTKVAVSAFEGKENITSVFIPDTISKVNNYAFSGVTANLYIQRNKPTVGEIPSGWGLYWNSNRSGQEGTRTLYWGVIDMDRVGAYSYIFMADGTAIAVEYNGSTAVTSVDVPASVVFNDVVYTVTELGDELFANMMLLNKVTLNEGLKKIGGKVFYMDMALKNVTLPSTLEEIGSQAFVAAMALNEIYIPANVSKIGSLAFIGIDNLTIYCGTKKTIIGTAPTGYAIGWNTKIGFSDLGDLDLSSILKSIGTLLTKFTQTHDVIWNVACLPQTDSSGSVLPGTYTYILYNDGHAELVESNVPAGSLNTSYTIPSTITYNEVAYSVTTIKATAFAGNTRIKELIIPTSVTTIEENAFQGCNGLTIKTEHTSKPSGWNDNFNPDGMVVSYGYGVSTAEVSE